MKERKKSKCNDNIVTELICVLDRSGSMSSIKDDTIGSFNSFLKDQQEAPGKALMTVMLFNDEYEMMHDGVDIGCVEPLTNKTYVPAGTTALFDAIGEAITKAECRFEKGKTNRVLFTIITDGQENASKEFDKCKIMNLINKCKEKYEWEFLYLSASPSAFTDGHSIGIGNNRIMHFSHTGRGIRGMTAVYGCSATSYRSYGRIDDLKPH